MVTTTAYEVATFRSTLLVLLQQAPRPLSTPELAIKIADLVAPIVPGRRWRARDLRHHLMAMEKAGQVVRMDIARGRYWAYSPHLHPENIAGELS